jgi:PAS domain S-box-containing protein
MSRRDPIAWGIVALGVFLLFFLPWWAKGQFSTSMSDRLTGLAAAPSGFLLILTVIRMRRTDKPDLGTRRVWYAIGFATVLYGLGALINLTVGLIPGLGGIPAFGVVFEVAAYVAVGLGLSLLPKLPGTTRYDIALFSLDLAIVAWSVAMLLWHLVIYQIAHDAHQSILASIGAAVFPTLDIALVLTLVALVLRGLRRSTTVALIVAACALSMVFLGDMVAETEILRQVYSGGGASGTLYSVAWLAMALAAYLQWRVADDDRQVVGLQGYARTFPLVTYVAMTLAFVLPVIGAWDEVDKLRLHVPASGLLIGLALLRLAVTSRLNASFAAAERERLAAAVDQAAEAIFTTDRAGHITYVNRAFGRLIGSPTDAIVGRDPAMFRRYLDAQALAEMTDALRRGESWAGLLTLKRPDGTSIDIDMTVAPLRDAANAIGGSVAVARDVSHERALELQLAQAQRMEAVGRLAGGIAHDFNNILTAISGFAELAAAELPDDHPVAPDIAQILRASDRAAALTRALLAFSRRQVMQPRLIDLNDVLNGLTPMLGRLIGEDVDLVVKLAPKLGLTMADRAQLEQVVVNMAVNARDAMPSGGKLTLTTSNTHLDTSGARAHVGAVAGPYVSLTVADTGTGMTPEVLEHAFEPFFTTKERGKGTGLGLSTAIGIVAQSGGYVAVKSKPKAGTVFTVSLPRHLGDSVPEASPVGSGKARGGSETILVAEDEDAVREFVMRVLAGAGYRVFSAPHGKGAIATAVDLPKLDLLITDVVMPGMSGIELATNLAASRPGLPVIYASGYADEGVLDPAIVHDGLPYLRKPFTADELTNAVRDILDRRAPKPDDR